MRSAVRSVLIIFPRHQVSPLHSLPRMAEHIAIPGSFIDSFFNSDYDSDGCLESDRFSDLSDSTGRMVMSSRVSMTGRKSTLVTIVLGSHLVRRFPFTKTRKVGPVASSFFTGCCIGSASRTLQLRPGPVHPVQAETV